MSSSNQADLAGEQGRAIHLPSWLFFMFPLTKGPARGPEGPACVHERAQEILGGIWGTWGQEPVQIGVLPIMQLHLFPGEI